MIMTVPQIQYDRKLLGKLKSKEGKLYEYEN